MTSRSRRFSCLILIFIAMALLSPLSSVLADPLEDELKSQIAKLRRIDQSVADQWERELARQGGTTMGMAFAHAYLVGRGVRKDAKVALELYRLIAKTGSAETQYMVANDLLIMADKAIEREFHKEALVWMKAAADQKDLNAIWALAEMYQEGFAVPVDYSKARTQYLLAEKLGASTKAVQAALVALDRLEREGRSTNTAAKAAQAPANRAFRSKEEFRRQFLEKHRIKHIVEEDDLTVNPFIYKDKVVGIPTKFNRMIAEDEALFYFENFGSIPKAILVSDVPSTLFASKRYTLLAIRVIGTKPFRTGQGEVSLPYGEFVAEHNCEAAGCRELLE